MNTQSNFPSTGFVRLPQIIGDTKSSPPIPAVLPISKAAFWAGIRSGRYPKPIKLGPQTTAWRVTDILALIENDGVWPVKEQAA